MIRVADYIADFIYSQGVKYVFILSGGGSIYLDDGIARHKQLRYICVRNEVVAPMMANAYARLTQNLGAVYVTTGPGGTNILSSVAEAWGDSVPILVISGQVQRGQIIKCSRTFGIQGFDVVKVVKPVTKYAVTIYDPNSIRYHLEKAVHYAKSGRPGPVWIDVPLDVQAAVVDKDELKGYESEQMPVISKNLDARIEDILNLLKVSKRPVIIAGQGIKISKSINEFKKLIEYLNIPAIFTRMSNDILPFSHKNKFGCGGITGLKSSNLIMKQSDLLISLGSRLAVPFVGINLDAFSKDAKIIMVDIDEEELNKPGLRIDLPINTDVKEFITRLLDKITGVILPDYSDWIKTCQTYKDKYALIPIKRKRNPIDLYYFFSRLDELSRENTIFITDAGTSYHIAEQVLKFEKGRREISSGAFAAMGLSIPFSVGCSVADRDAQVFVLTGDGSLELNIQELKTISYYGLNIKVFIMNNSGYVTIRNIQDRLFDGRYIGSDRTSSNEMLNLEKVSNAFDLPYFRIEKYEEIDDKILEVIRKSGPAFIDVVCDKNQKLIESY